MSASSGVIHTGSVSLYVESGAPGKPPLLLIPGGGADCGMFDTTIAPLSERFSVVSYDRRGNSRSPRPDGWGSTSIEEQAGDAVALLTELGHDRVDVFGTSWGALIALDLALRHPEAVKTVVVHEAPLFDVLPDANEIADGRRALVGSLVAVGEYEAAFAKLVHTNNGSVLDGMEPALRERFLANARVFFELELPGFAGYLPTREALAASEARIVVSAGELSRGKAMYAATSWIAAESGSELVELPGGHAPYLDDQPGPTVFASALVELFDF